MLKIWLLVLSMVKVHGSERPTLRFSPPSLEKEVSGGYNYTLNCEYNISYHDFSTSFAPNFALRYKKVPCSETSQTELIYVSKTKNQSPISGLVFDVSPKEIPHNWNDTDFPLIGNITLHVEANRPDASSEMCGYAHHMCEVIVEIPDLGGTTTTTQTANVSFIVRAQIKNVSSETVVEEGQPIDLFCIATGLPLPTITWHRINGQSFPEQGGQTEYKSLDGKLTIPRAEPHHAGEYICTADNKFNRPVTEKVKVMVQYKPLVSADAVVVYQQVDYHTELRCSATANPEINTHGWERRYANGNREELNITNPSSSYYELEAAKAQSSGSDSSYQILARELTSTLVIRSVQSNDFKGSFCCFFSNNVVTDPNFKCIEVEESNEPVKVNGKPAQYYPVSGIPEHLPSQLLVFASILLALICMM